jgi:3-oxosteroid 1-dehydrogenase
VERAEQLGGTTALSGGRVWVPGNHRQDGDSPAAAAAYLDGVFSDRYPEMTETFLRTGPEMLRFVERHSTHRFAACPGYLPLSFAEWDRWRYPDRFDWDLLAERDRAGIRTGGVALVAGLLDGVVRAGAQVRAGVRLAAVRPGQADLSHPEQVTTVGATAVVLATGGFDWDRELRARYHPAAQRASGAPPTNTGDGLRIATDAGASTDNLAEGWWMPMLAIPGETLLGEQFYRSLIRERGLPRQIMVGAAGRRFVNEALPYNEIGKALHRQDGPAYLVFDEGYRARYPMPGLARNGAVPGWVACGRTPGELAGRIGVDPTTLARTVRRWNAACAAGADPDFGRGTGAYQRFCGDPGVSPNPSLGPLDQPPYYAAEVLAGTIGTKGGPVTDTDGLVLRGDGRPVTGLYAVGNAAAFWTADGYPGPGATLAIAMTMGYRAGLHAGRAVR